MHIYIYIYKEPIIGAIFIVKAWGCLVGRELINETCPFLCYILVLYWGDLIFRCWGACYLTGRPISRFVFLFPTPCFLAPFCSSARKKETTLTWRERTAERRKERKKERSTWRESRTLSLKRSVWLQNPEAPKGVSGCNTLSAKRSVGLRSPKPEKECCVAKP